MLRSFGSCVLRHMLGIVGKLLQKEVHMLCLVVFGPMDSLVISYFKKTFTFILIVSIALDILVVN